MTQHWPLHKFTELWNELTVVSLKQTRYIINYELNPQQIQLCYKIYIYTYKHPHPINNTHFINNIFTHMHYKFSNIGYQEHNQPDIRQLISVQMFNIYSGRRDRRCIDRSGHLSPDFITSVHNQRAASLRCYLFYFFVIIFTLFPILFYFYFISLVSHLYFFPYFKRCHLSSSHFSTVTIVLLSHSRAPGVRYTLCLYSRLWVMRSL